MKAKKIVTRLIAAAVLLALVLWLVPLPVPVGFTMTGAEVNNDYTAGESVTLTDDGWRLYRFLREPELHATITVQSGNGEIYAQKLSGCWDSPIPTGARSVLYPVYDRTTNDFATALLVYDTKETAAVLYDGFGHTYAASAEPMDVRAVFDTFEKTYQFHLEAQRP